MSPRAAEAAEPDAPRAPSASGGETYEFAPELIALSGDGPDRGEPIRQIAAELLGQHVALGRRGIAVCSAASGAGTTFIAANLAVAIAQAGVETLLVDANLARPGLNRLIRAHRLRAGLGEYLRDPAMLLADVLHDQVLDHLSLVFAGEAAGRADDLLIGERFEAFIEACLRNFECVVVDTPAANRSANTRRIGSVVGYALIVARRNQTFADDLKVLRSELEQDRVVILGSVLNDA